MLLSTAGASDAEHERMNRGAPVGAPSLSALIKRTWWIVGTAVYQVARCSRKSGQKAEAEKRGGIISVPPETSVDKAAPINPCP
jgi:hypothetical protein